MGSDTILAQASHGPYAPQVLKTLPPALKTADPLKQSAPGIYAYFDRVPSESNPVDGLSRGRSKGPWQQVAKARLPTNLEELLQAEGSSSSDLD